MTGGCEWVSVRNYCSTYVTQLFLPVVHWCCSVPLVHTGTINNKITKIVSLFASLLSRYVSLLSPCRRLPPVHTRGAASPERKAWR